METDDTDHLTAPMSRFSSNVEQKVIVQRNSPIMFQNTSSMAIGASFLAPSSNEQNYEEEDADNNIFASIINKSALAPVAEPVPSQKSIHRANLTQKILNASASMKALQQRMNNSGIKMQIGRTDIVSLKSKNQNASTPPPKPQPRAEEKVVVIPPPNYKILKTLAPKAVITSFTSTVIKPGYNVTAVSSTSKPRGSSPSLVGRTITSSGQIKVVGRDEAHSSSTKSPIVTMKQQQEAQNKQMLYQKVKVQPNPPKKVVPVPIPAKKPIILNQTQSNTKSKSYNPPLRFTAIQSSAMPNLSITNNPSSSTTESQYSTDTYEIIAEASDSDDMDEDDDNIIFDLNDRINLEIIDGKISDPNGPIKLLTIDNESSMLDVSEAEVSSTTDQRTSSRPHSPSSIKVNILDKHLLRSPRLQKRAKSDVQQSRNRLHLKRRLSVPASDNDDILENTENNDPIGKSRETYLKKKSVSTRTVDSSLLCNEKFEMESDESRSIKTSISSLNNIPHTKQDKNLSYDESKLQAAIEKYKQSQTPSQRSKLAKQFEDKQDGDDGDLDFYSMTPSDLIKWDDGVGYLRDSSLHFQFNNFGMIEPLEDREYFRHVKTNVYDTLKEPLHSRTVTKNLRNKRKLLITEAMYRCRGCQGRGTASDFATPEYCSVTCMKQTKNHNMLHQLQGRSKSLLRGTLGSSDSEFSNTPQGTSDEDSMSSIFTYPRVANARKDDEKKKTTKFTWEDYLKKGSNTTAPLSLFINPYPSVKNKFKIGMKLEAIDPENNSLFCVCTIVEIRGYRIKLTFDGFSREFDFWVNADSMDIFPPGWCKKTGRTLLAPFGYAGDFEWLDYLTQSHSLAASRYLFTHLNSSASNQKSLLKDEDDSQQSNNKFKVGMHLEADDLKNTGKLCVATITDMIDNRVLIHFDGADDRCDYWVDISSPYIHPVNWHQKNNCALTPPPDWTEGEFTWSKYLKPKSRKFLQPIADEKIFSTRRPFQFKPGMKLEVVDRKNQLFIRPATVIAIDGYEIKVCYDGWPSFYSFWIEDDSTDIHPINWCRMTDHPIEFPPDRLPVKIRVHCELQWCLGYGNATVISNKYHKKISECPYDKTNWLNEEKRKSRVVKRKRVNVPRPIIETVETDIKIEQPDITSDSQVVENVPRTTKTAEAKPAVDGPKDKTPWKDQSKILEKSVDGSSEFNKNPLNWDVEEVALYIEKFPGCKTIGNFIREEDVSGSAFLSLTQDDLTKYFDIKLGPAIKVYNRIVALRKEVETKFMQI